MGVPDMEKSEGPGLLTTAWHAELIVNTPSIVGAFAVD
jgi:hypothetical protein